LRREDLRKQTVRSLAANPPVNQARCSNELLEHLSIFMKQTTYLATLPNPKA
jgi:hypothetical protein